MNKIFKVIFNRATGKLVVVSELTKSNGKAASQTDERSQPSGSSLLNVGLAGAVMLGAALMASNNAFGWANSPDMKATNSVDNNTTVIIGAGTAETDKAYVGAGNSIAIGASSRANNRSSVAIGQNATTNGDQSIALGSLANATTIGGTAVGYNATSGSYAVAMGWNATANSREAVVIGYNAAVNTTSTGSQGVAIGSGTVVNASQAIGIGNQVTVDGYGAIALGGDDIGTTEVIPDSVQGITGFKAQYEGNWAASDTNVPYGEKTDGTDSRVYVKTAATGRAAIAMGAQAQATANWTTAIGTRALANKEAATAVGMMSKATGNASFAGGLNATASNNYTAATGANATASGDSASAYGYNATATGKNSVAVGKDAASSGPNTTTMGMNATALNESGSAYGYNASSNGANSVAVGKDALAARENATSIGMNAQALGNNTIAIGRDAVANTQDVGGLAIGKNANATGKGNFALGTSAFANYTNVSTEYAMAIGDTSRANATRSLALGVGAQIQENATGAVAIGNSANVSNNSTSAIAIGNISKVGTGSDQGIAIGYNANLTNNTAGSIIVGGTSTVKSKHAVAIGYGTSIGEGKQGAVVLGANSNDTGSHTITDVNSATINGITYSGFKGDINATTGGSFVSVGSNGANAQRKIINVAAGVIDENSTEAINGSQLYAVASQIGQNKAVVKAGANTTVSTAVNTTTGGTDYTVDISDATKNDITNIKNNITTLNNSKTKYFSVKSTVTENENNAGATATNAIAVGPNASSAGQNGIAIGTDVTSGSGTQINTIAIGYNSSSTVESAVAYGANTRSSGVGSVAIGRTANASTNGAIAIGVSSQVISGNHAIVIGDSAKANGTKSLALGVEAKTNADYATALGNKATANGTNSVALGNSSTALSNNVTVLGSGVTVNQGFDNAVVLGANSNVNGSHTIANVTEATVNGITYSGFAGTVNSTGNFVSVGGSEAGQQRKIINVAAGAIDQNSTEAINGSQLYAVAKSFEDSLKNLPTTLPKNLAEKLGLPTDSTGNVTNDLGIPAVAGSNNANTAPTTLTGAVKDVAEAVNKGISLQGNDTNPINKKLGQTFDVVGTLEASKTASSKNVRTKTTNGKLEILISENPEFESVSAGTLAVKNTDGTAGPKMTSAGIDAASKKITNVAAGTDDKDAVNFSQLKALKDVLGVAIGPDGNLTSEASNIRNSDGSLNTNPDLASTVRSQTTAINRGIVYGADSDEYKSLAANNAEANARKQQLGSTLAVKSATEALSKASITGKEFVGTNLVTKYVRDEQGNGLISIGMSDKPEFKEVTVVDPNDQTKSTTLTPTGTKVKDGNKEATYGVDGVGLKGADGKTTTIGKNDNGDLTVTKTEANGQNPTTDVLATKADVDKAAKGTDGKDGKNGKNADGTVNTDSAGGKGLTGADGLNGKDLNSKVNALRNGEAGPIVYTAPDGTRLEKANDGKYYPAAKVDDDGNPATDATAVDNPVASVVNADGTTTKPATMGNVKSTIGLNGKNATGAELGPIDAAAAKNAVAGADGQSGLLAKKGAELNNVATVGDLQALAQAGLDFTGDNNTTVHRPLGTKLTVEGEGTWNGANSATDNLYVEANATSNTLTVKLNSNLTGLNKVGLKGADGNVTTIGRDVDGNLTVTNGKDGANPQPQKLVTEGNIANMKGTDGKDGKDGTNATSAGAKGLTGKDGLNGASLNDKINALRNGEAGPVVYTDADGKRLEKANDGKYYLADQVNPDGATPVASPIASVVNSNGSTTAPVKLGNIANATTTYGDNGDLVEVGGVYYNKADLINGQPKADAVAVPAAKAGIANLDAAAPNTALTVADAKNLGWVLSTPNSNYSAAVKNANTVNFKGTDGVEVEGAANTTTGTYDVVFRLSEAGKLALEAMKDAAGTGTIAGSESGRVAVVDNPAGFVGAQTIADMINGSGWKTNSTTATGGAKDTLISAGDVVNFEAGKNIQVTQTVNATTGAVSYTYATADKVSFDEITLGDAANGTTTITNAGTVVTKFDPTGNATTSSTYGADGLSTKALDPKTGTVTGETTVSPTGVNLYGKDGKDGKDAKPVASLTNTVDTAGNNNPSLSFAKYDAVNGTGKVTGLKDVERNLDGTAKDRTQAANAGYVDDRLAEVNAGKPFEYFEKDPVTGEVKTDANGKPVVLVRGQDGKFYKDGELDGKTFDEATGTYKNADGTPLAAKPVDSNNVTVQAMPSPTGAPIEMGNVGSGLGLDDSKDGNKTPLTADVAKEAIGGADGKSGLLGKTGDTLNNIATVKDLQALAQSGLDFTGNNSDTTVHRPLSTKLTVKGEGAWDGKNSAADNLYVEAKADTNELVVKMNKDLTGLSSVETTDAAGNVAKMTAAGTTVKDAAGNSATYGANGLTVADKDGNPTITLVNSATGPSLNFAKNADGTGTGKITGVAAGDITPNSSDVVTGAQLYQLTGGNTIVNNPNGATTSTAKGLDGKTIMTTDENGNQVEKQYTLTTYNVEGQTEFVTNSVITAVHNMNEQGIKFFHTNDAVATPINQASNSIDSSASGAYATAVGYQAKADGTNAIAMGKGATAAGENSIAIGTGNQVLANKAGAFGDPNIIEQGATGSYAIGNDNVITSSNTFVLGNDVNNSGNVNGQPVAMGNTVENSVYLGNKSTATAGDGSRTGTLKNRKQDGSEGTTTTAGSTGTVSSAKVGNMTYGGFAGAKADGVVSVGAAGNERRVQNVAAGEISATSTDAINGSQLYSVAQGVDKLDGKVNRMNRKLRSGIAAATAMTNIPQVTMPGKSALGAGVGSYDGQGALAVGYSRMSDSGRVIFKVSAGATTQGKYNAGAGVALQW